MIDPPIVSSRELAYLESHPKLEELSTAELLIPCQDSASLLCRAETERSRSVLWSKSPLIASSCIAASSGSIRTRTLCGPERTGIISDRLPCTASVGINPNLFLVEPVTLPEY